MRETLFSLKVTEEEEKAEEKEEEYHDDISRAKRLFRIAAGVSFLHLDNHHHHHHHSEADQGLPGCDGKAFIRRILLLCPFAGSREERDGFNLLPGGGREGGGVRGRLGRNKLK